MLVRFDYYGIPEGLYLAVHSREREVMIQGFRIISGNPDSLKFVVSDWDDWLAYLLRHRQTVVSALIGGELEILGWGVVLKDVA